MNQIRKRLVPFVLLINFSLFSFSLSASAPSFCNGLECPEFSVISQSDNIEIREYKTSHWVSTNLNNGHQDDLRKTGFWRLYNYITGKNEQKLKINMTAPVLFKINASTAFSEEDQVYTMSFYLGDKFQSDDSSSSAPIPTEQGVFLQKLESNRYAVISYSGYSNQFKQEENLRNLGSYLKSNQIKFNDSHYFFAGYDSPYRVFNRHNEVWVELN
jgi:hypothetical protein